MKAAFYETTGPAKEVLKVGPLEIRDPLENEVQIKIVFSGINPYDVKLRAGVYGDLQFPRVIPHNDGSGIVQKIGSNVRNFKIGDRVWIYNAGWKGQYGTACTHCNIPEHFLAPLPSQTSFELGAMLGIPALTAASSLLSLNVQKNATIMITGGAGMVSLFAIQLAKFLGLQVATTVSSVQKAQLAHEAGADFVFDKNTPYTGDLLDGLIDVDFGGNIEWSIDALKPNTTIASYASMGNPTPQLPFYKMLVKQITLKPILVYILEESLKQKSIELIQKALAADILKPTLHKIYDLDQIVDAHQEVESGQKIGHVLLNVKE